MILIYSNTTSYRLQYICQFIFKEQLGVQYNLTLNNDGFAVYDGPKINYSQITFDGDERSKSITILNHELLFEKDIREQNASCFDTDNFKAIFPIASSDLSFDIFAACFYLLSRYEEYLPHTKDEYGRYAHTNSVAFKHGFLNQPLVNTWVNHLGNLLKVKYPGLDLNPQPFRFLPTYDIDIAYSYKSKGFLRNAGGFLRSPSADRIKVLLGLKKDPFDAYDFLHTLHKENGLHPVYFFLVAEHINRYDKNISPHKKAMVDLIRDHARRYSIGIHPSWKSNESISALIDEKNYIEDICDTAINNSRQHYIKFNVPQTFEELEDAGILNDFSMGYGSINGFRASVASSFYWFDLKKDKQSLLRLHPFCFMDANSFYEQKISAETAYDELIHYYSVCMKDNGCLITIFHNNFLGDDKKFKGWKEMYVRFISQIQR